MSNLKLKNLPTALSAICVSLFLIIPANVHAGIENDMADMFNSMGVEGNYTEGGAFHGQAGSLYTGGSLSVRAPVSHLNPVNVQPPSISAGCGGIDFFAGGFSFVNKEQFIAFTRNLGNNAAGVAFELALKALDPMIQDAIGEIRNVADMINQGNMNSCQAARQVVGGVMGKIAEGMTSGCKAEVVGNGSEEAGAAPWYCQSAARLKKAADEARGSGSPQDVIDITGGNLAYEAIKRFGGNRIENFSEEEIDLMISLSGTAVFFPIKEKSGKEGDVTTDHKVYEPTIKKVTELLDNQNLEIKNAGTDQETATITLNILQCRDGTDKLREVCAVNQNTRIFSIRHKIKRLLKKLVDNIIQDAEWNAAQREEMVKLVNHTSMPILRMAVSDAFLNTHILASDAMVNAITIEYLEHILSNYERAIRSASGLFSKTGEVGDKDKDRLYGNLRELRQSLYTAKQATLETLEAEKTLNNAISHFDTQWRENYIEMGNSLRFDEANRL
ncbi:conjugal transfer protein TraH [Stenoxybacter acetivorans]|uniref:conjugal transfer protein TraH n=1 Tax=Stenoxybacter acetivorans TaxID=422441 RepID=UPI000566C36C|nr:conjugal transfer protein TraH [Stenoxybacter acetivorans]